MHTDNKAIEFEGKSMRERGIEATSVFLERRGYDILERNWNCEAGAIDIVARDEDVLVFVEVVVQDAADGPIPEEDLTPEKRSAAELAAGGYLAAANSDDVTVRFDIVSLLIINSSRALLRHHINAFGI